MPKTLKKSAAGRKIDPELVAAFTRVFDEKRDAFFGTCIACKKEYKWQSNNLKNHLRLCQKEPKTKQISTLLEKPEILVSNMHALTQYHQKIPTEKQYYLKKQLTMAIIMDGLPFNAFTSGKMLPKVLRQISQAVHLPSPHDITTNILDDLYESTKLEVLKVLNAQKYLNFTMDESSNIQKRRVLNLCTNIPKIGAFYLVSDVLGSEKLDAEFLSKWLHKKLIEYSNNDLFRINSFATDTCSTQQKVATSLTTLSDGLQHLFWAPCDSHGLQLLIRDFITKFPPFEKAMKVANAIASAFSYSPKSMAVLREKAKNYNLSFALSVLTRWGTQISLLNSLNAAKYPIQEFFEYLPDDASPALKTLKIEVENLQNWKYFEIIHALLEPINHALKGSEADASSLIDVIPRWKRILAHVHAALAEHNITSGMHIFEPIMRARFKRQITRAHILAYMVNPATIDENIIPYWTQAEINNCCRDFFYKYCTTLDDLPSMVPSHVAAMSQLTRFRQKEGVFDASQWIWEHKSQPSDFWDLAAPYAPELAAIARRLIRTPATSVPSERAFSIMNLLHNKFRNRLRSDRVDKLQFIYINQRVLKRIGVERANWEPPLEVEDPEELLDANDGSLYDPGVFEDLPEGFDQIFTLL